ncbi:hypothetical protein TNCV_411731 [Trichonephila clavipes]|nr:hypothetical protein TNCV_411731 [Trichonephila clavipes]
MPQTAHTLIGFFYFRILAPGIISVADIIFALSIRLGASCDEFLSRQPQMDRLLDLPFDLYQRISATFRVPTFTVPLTNHNSAIQTIQDFSAETVFMKNSDSVATPSCHVRPTNQDTLSQAGPPTSGHIHYLDMGWRNASRSVSQ